MKNKKINTVANTDPIEWELIKQAVIKLKMETTLTNEEIAKKLSITKERVRQIVCKYRIKQRQIKQMIENAVLRSMETNNDK